MAIKNEKHLFDIHKKMAWNSSGQNKFIAAARRLVLSAFSWLYSEHDLGSNCGKLYQDDECEEFREHPFGSNKPRSHDHLVTSRFRAVIPWLLWLGMQPIEQVCG